MRTFRDVPEAIANTVHLASRLNFELDELVYEFPCYKVPNDDTMDSFLRKRVEEGFSGVMDLEVLTYWSGQR